MPKGLCILVENEEKNGLETKMTVPEGINVMDSTVQHLYKMFVDFDEPEITNFISGPTNVVCYYTGPETRFYIVMLLELEENIADYEEALADTAILVLKNMENHAYKSVLSSIYQRIIQFPKFTKEQRIANLYSSLYKRQILERLRNEGILFISELKIWFREEISKNFGDIEAIVNSLTTSGFVKQISVKNLISNVLFLTRDFSISIIPPVDFITNIDKHDLPEDLRWPYKSEIKDYFSTYKPSEEDVLNWIDNIILDPEAYPMLKLLRETAVNMSDIEKLKKKGVGDPEEVLKKLIENRVAIELKSELGSKFYCLLSDFRILTFFPDYLLDIMRGYYTTKSQNNFVLEEILEDLKEVYMDLERENRFRPKYVEIINSDDK